MSFFSFLFFPLLIIWMLQHLIVCLFLGREKQLASKIAELVEEKCTILEKLSLCKKEVMVVIYCFQMWGLIYQVFKPLNLSKSKMLKTF